MKFKKHNKSWSIRLEYYEWGMQCSMALKRVRELHRAEYRSSGEFKGKVLVCSECLDIYPCNTIKEIDMEW